MKRLSLLVLLLALLLATGCQSTAAEAEAEVVDVDVVASEEVLAEAVLIIPENAPAWVTEGYSDDEHVYVVGTGNLGNATDSYYAANEAARASLGALIQERAREILLEKYDEAAVSGMLGSEAAPAEFSLREYEHFDTEDGAVFILLGLTNERFEAAAESRALAAEAE